VRAESLSGHEIMFFSLFVVSVLMSNDMYSVFGVCSSE
jgi:hypothetical protein